MTDIKLYVPRDAAALAMGADRVAKNLAAALTKLGKTAQIVRNGSRGMLWLEPMVELVTPKGRVAFGPVTTQQVESLAQAIVGGTADKHPLHLGLTEEIPYFKRQERMCFARVGLTDPVSVADYRTHGGLRGLENALQMKPADIVAQVTESGLRGRGGAGFPTGIKWTTVLNAQAEQKYIVCNADEGDSGTFSDRMLMEGDPLCLIEGMIIAGLGVGADKGFIYLRSEYPHAKAILTEALAEAYKHGVLGPNILGTGRRFDLELRIGAGAYICGEETSLLESLEGKRGMIRFKPPLPAIKGLFGQPTVVNNVITLASLPIILDKGGAYYRDFGMGRSRGTLPFQLAGNIKHGGLVEKAFGMTLRELIYDYGGGTASGRPLRAVQIGGPLGAYVPESLLDTPTDYEALAKVNAMLGHGGIVVFDDTVDMAKMAHFALEFCATESCGKCTPCRLGSTRGAEVMERIMAKDHVPQQVELLKDLCDTMTHASLCALGGLTPMPVMSALEHFPEDFGLAARKPGLAA